MNNNIIRLITTEGCEACNIAEKLTNQAIIDAEINDVELEIVDCLDPYYYDFIVSQEISDYPTTIFIKDGFIKDKFTGTTTRKVITSKIVKYFGEI